MNGNLDLACCCLRRLIKQRNPLSHVSGPDANHRVRSLVIVGAPAKNLDTDHAFAQRFVFSAQAMENDVMEQILTLAAGAKGKAARHLFERLSNALLSLFSQRAGRRQKASFLATL